jgi:hypothetical protein
MGTKRLLTLVLSLGIFALISVNNAGAQIGTTTTTRTSNRQMQTLLVRIETKIDILKEEAQREGCTREGRETPRWRWRS